MLIAFLFGITVALAVGPIALLIMATGISHGLRFAVRPAIGAALADLTCALVAFAAGGAVVAALSAAGSWLPFASALILLGFGLWMMWTALARRAGADAPPGRPVGTLATYLLTLSNPMTLIAFIGFALQGLPATGAAGVLARAGALFLGSLLAQLALAAAGAGLKLVLSARVVRALNLLSGAGITTFGVVGLVRALA